MFQGSSAVDMASPIQSAAAGRSYIEQLQDKTIVTIVEQ